MTFTLVQMMEQTNKLSCKVCFNVSRKFRKSENNQVSAVVIMDNSNERFVFLLGVLL